MAENDGTTNSPAKSGSDEIISLEKLVAVEPPGPKSSIAGAPVPPQKTEPKQTAGPAAAAGASAHGGPDEDLDRLLAIEDPGFADSLKELSELKLEVGEVGSEVVLDTDLESIVLRERVEGAIRGPKKVFLFLVVRPVRSVKATLIRIKAKTLGLRTTAIPAIKEGLKYSLAKLKGGAGTAIHGIKLGFSWFSALPKSSKFLLLGVIILGVTSSAVIVFTFRKHLLPTFQTSDVTSLGKLADSEYSFEDSDGWENLNDPFLHPEHMVLIDRIIANLKPASSDGNPMTMMELFIETSSQEAAVELRDRDAEARDVIGRTLNQMPYDELVTINGKNKVKVFLRKDLNEIMTKGRIRRVFFKSLILKP